METTLCMTKLRINYYFHKRSDGNTSPKYPTVFYKYKGVVIRICVRKWLYTHIHVYIQIHTRIYTYIHTRTYKYTRTRTNSGFKTTVVLINYVYKDKGFVNF